MPSAAAALTRNADVHTVVHVYGEQLACSPNALHDAIAMAHQQIRGRCSPTSMSTIRSPPNPMRRTTIPVGTSCTSPMMAESRPAGCDRIASTRRRAFRARTIATSFPSFPGWPDRADRGPGSRTHLDLRAERKRCLIDTREALANSLRTLANPPRLASPRLASRRQRRLGHASNMAAARLASGWQSLAMSPSKTSVPQESTSGHPDMAKSLTVPATTGCRCRRQERTRDRRHSFRS
jgi:hypothetical protein